MMNQRMVSLPGIPLKKPLSDICCASRDEILEMNLLYSIQKAGEGLLTENREQRTENRGRAKVDSERAAGDKRAKQGAMSGQEAAGSGKAGSG